MCCSITCSIAAVFLLAMIYFDISTLNSEVVKKYKESLPSDLQVIHDKIAKERLSISMAGYSLGLILSIIIIFLNTTVKRNLLGTKSLVCIVVTTSFLTNYFYYTLSPKSDWMLNHLKTPEQNKAWLEMYRTMKYNYHLGFVFGIIAVGLLAFAFRC
jgi:uncharacterized membrane protein YkgB